MIRRSARARSGITLTEILISILIMGIGVISIATLFPIGLLRLRNAQRLTRGAYLIESAIADLGARDLLNQQSFKVLSITPWFITPSGQYYPWLQDTQSYGGDWFDQTNKITIGANRGFVPGLPICYDPLWRCITGNYPDPNGSFTPECRFGSGIGFLRNDPNAGNVSALPSAHGLQRVSNLISTATGAQIAGLTYPLTAAQITQYAQNYLTVLQTFVSPEDLILQDPKGQYTDPVTGGQLVSPSPIVPDMTSVLNLKATSYDNDWRYSWFFTGTLASADGTIFEGELVVCENRQFGLDTPFTAGKTPGNIYKVTGETVVEAVWGWGSSSASTSTNPVLNPWYASAAANRSVLLRWPASQPDPEIKVGNWIADVTYERNQLVVNSGRFPNTFQPQRCEWYQVAKRTDPDAGVVFPGDNGVAYRQITVWTTTPLRSQSLLSFTAGAPATPYHVEAALIMPSVVNVYPRTVYSR